MKRFHVHLRVKDLRESIGFYTTAFGAAPSVEKHDYAKWMLEDPRLNFAISTGGAAGIEHLGLQADTPDELAAMRQQVEGKTAIFDEPDTTCCYANSSKHWVSDPQGIRWERFYTRSQVDEACESTRPEGKLTACCAPSTDAAAPKKAACCG